MERLDLSNVRRREEIGPMRVKRSCRGSLLTLRSRGDGDIPRDHLLLGRNGGCRRGVWLLEECWEAGLVVFLV